MKAYHDAEGRVRLFRPDMNMKRMNTSANRIALPVRKNCFRIIQLTLTIVNLYITDIRWRCPIRAYQGTCPSR